MNFANKKDFLEIANIFHNVTQIRLSKVLIYLLTIKSATTLTLVWLFKIMKSSGIIIIHFRRVVNVLM